MELWCDAEYRLDTARLLAASWELAELQREFRRGFAANDTNAMLDTDEKARALLARIEGP